MSQVVLFSLNKFRLPPSHLNSGHSETVSGSSSVLRKAGPFHHLLFEISVSTLSPLGKNSEGLSCPEQRKQESGLVNLEISCTLLAANCFHLFEEPLIQNRTILESVQWNTLHSIFLRTISRTLELNRAVTKAPKSSSRGKVSAFRGATIVFEVMRFTSTSFGFLTFSKLLPHRRV
ncbi:hypothetical protein TNCV_4084341 [Trichonephila clavipes]|nr:hypothetical protein TNCV_4084341 [Trichonephila clavipes]